MMAIGRTTRISSARAQPRTRDPVGRVEKVSVGSDDINAPPLVTRDPFESLAATAVAAHREQALIGIPPSFSIAKFTAGIETSLEITPTHLQFVAPAASINVIVVTKAFYADENIIVLDH